MNPAQTIAPPLTVKRTGSHIALVDAKGRTLFRKVVSSVSMEDYNQLDADLLAICAAFARPAPPDTIPAACGKDWVFDAAHDAVNRLSSKFERNGIAAMDSHRNEIYQAILRHIPQPPAPAVAQDGPREQVITEVELTDKGCLVFGQPSVSPWLPEDEGHNCDAMGCASVGDHVLAKVPFTDQRSNVSVETGALYLKDQDGPGGASHS